MKKIFAILIVAVVFSACNGTEEKTTTTVDSTSAESPLMDAVSTRDSATKIIQDNTKPVIDTTIKK